MHRAVRVARVVEVIVSVAVVVVVAVAVAVAVVMMMDRCRHAMLRRALDASQPRLRTRPQSQDGAPMTTTATGSLTIGRLARAAGVGVETIRYYQALTLLPVPEVSGGYRRYPAALVERIRFVKRAQELGFTLAEVGELLHLEDGADRRAIRRIAGQRLAQVEGKLADLRRMQQLLVHLLHACEHTGGELQCPIIATLAGTPPSID